MILLKDYTPEVYYQQSRDFQFIGRLFDLVLNSLKTNADMIYDVPASDAAGSKLIDLLALTLCFKATHEYNIKQLINVCSILSVILRNKGSLKAIELVCSAILNAEGITLPYAVIKNGYTVQIYMPQSVSDLNLLKDLLDYILPAGLSCEIKRTTLDANNLAVLRAKVSNILAAWDLQRISELSHILTADEASEIILDKDNPIKDDENNAGLLTNSIVSSEIYVPSNNTQTTNTEPEEPDPNNNENEGD